MEKLEIKLTLTAASTPELLAYLQDIQSARDRAYILKRLATRGLMSVDGAIREDVITFPARVTPDTRGSTAARTEAESRSAPEPEELQATAATPTPLAPRELSLAPTLPDQVPPPKDAPSIGATPPDSMNFDALNAAMERFY